MDKEKEKKYYQILPAELKEIYDDPELLDQIYEICLKIRHDARVVSDPILNLKFCDE